LCVSNSKNPMQRWVQQLVFNKRNNSSNVRIWNLQKRSYFWSSKPQNNLRFFFPWNILNLPAIFHGVSKKVLLRFHIFASPYKKLQNKKIYKRLQNKKIYIKKTWNKKIKSSLVQTCKQVKGLSRWLLRTQTKQNTANVSISIFLVYPFIKNKK